MSKRKLKKFRWLNWGTVFFFLCSWAAAYLISGQPLVKDSVFIDVPLIPQEAIFVASISTDSKQWQQLQQWGTPEIQAALKRRLTRLSKSLLGSKSESYQNLIKPFIGKEVTLAYLHSNLAQSTSPTPSVTEYSPKNSSKQKSLVLLLPLKNQLLAKQLWTQLNSQLKSKFGEKSYKKIKIKQIKNNNYCISLIGRFIVVSTDFSSMKRVIDTHQDSASSVITPRAEKALANISKTTDQNLAKFYLNIPAALEFATTLSSRVILPESIQQQTKQGIAGKVLLESEGLRIQGILWHKLNNSDSQNLTLAKNLPTENSVKNMAQNLPIETQFMFAGGNIKQLWQDFVAESESNPLIPIEFQPVILTNWIKSTTNLDWEQDFLPWMGDQISLALIPTKEEIFTLGKNHHNQLEGALVVMLQISDRDHGEQIWMQLDQTVATKHNFQVESFHQSAQPIFKWTSPGKKANFAYGWLEEDLLFFTLGSSIVPSLIEKPKQNLNGNELYQQTILTRLNPNQMQIFLDLDSPMRENIELLPFSPKQKMFLKAINTIGFTTAITDEITTSFKIVIQPKTIKDKRIKDKI
ncbi:MAG: DUF3352 domain-containing protein [Moorea sp. SIO2B7]|nr:DUF3352 domain-containing protein [Moorena sp. SIO2B7]